MKLKELVISRSGFQGKVDDGDIFSQIKLKDVNSGIINYGELETFKSNNVLDKYLLKKGDIIFKAKSGDNTAALINEDLENTVATSHFLIATIKEEYKNKINTAYITMYLNSEYAQNYFKKHAQGTALAIIKLASFEDLEIEVPALEEQNRLAELYELMLEEKQIVKQLLEQREKQLTVQLRSVIEGRR